MSETTDSDTVTYQSVYDLACRWQWQKAKDMAESCIQEARAHKDWADAGEDERREILSGIVNKSIDGCGTVIYTGRAMAYVFASSNDDAFEDEVGEPPPDVSTRAYYALRADVLEILGDVCAEDLPDSE